MQLLRKVLFWFFLICYVVICPLTVLYALGYVVKPTGEGGLLKTGLIYVSTEPPGASVYVEDRRFTQKTPTAIPDLLPGRYRIRVAAERSTPWLKTVRVEAGKSTVLEKILLFPDQAAPHLLRAGPFERITPMVDTPFLLLNAGMRSEDTFIYSEHKKTSWPLLPETVVPKGSRVVSFVTVPESRYVLVRLAVEGEDRYLWIKIKEGDAQAEDISRLLRDQHGDIRWDAERPRMLFSYRKQEATAHRIDIHNGAVYPYFLNEISGLGLLQEKIYVLRSDGVFSRMSYEGEKSEDIISHEDRTELFKGKGAFDVYTFSDDTVFFLGREGELLSNRSPYHLAERGVRGLKIDRKLKRVLIWGKNKIGVIDLHSRRRDEHGDRILELRWILDGAEDVTEAFWLYDDLHILFQDKDMLRALSTVVPGDPDVRSLVRVRPGSSAYYSDDSGCVYYLDAQKADFMMLDILPARRILSLSFMEPDGDESRV